MQIDLSTGRSKFRTNFKKRKKSETFDSGLQAVPLTPFVLREIPNSVGNESGGTRAREKGGHSSQTM